MGRRPAVGNISDVPTTGTATYTGHVIANVNSSAGLVAGGFSNTVDFGARTGAVSVTNLDSTNYTGNVNFNTDPRNFGGTIPAQAMSAAAAWPCKAASSRARTVRSAKWAEASRFPAPTVISAAEFSPRQALISQPYRCARKSRRGCVGTARVAVVI